MLLRRVLLASALSMISSSSTLQTFVVWVILVCFAVIHLCLHPYDDSNYKFASENFFEPLVLLVLSMSFILLKFSAVENLMTYSAAYVWVVMIVNSCTLLFLVGIIFYRLATCGNEDEDGNFSGHRHVSARNGRSSDDEERSKLLSVNSARKRYVEVANISQAFVPVSCKSHSFERGRSLRLNTRTSCLSIYYAGEVLFERAGWPVWSD